MDYSKKILILGLGCVTHLIILIFLWRLRWKRFPNDFKPPGWPGWLAASSWSECSDPRFVFKNGFYAPESPYFYVISVLKEERMRDFVVE